MARIDNPLFLLLGLMLCLAGGAVWSAEPPAADDRSIVRIPYSGSEQLNQLVAEHEPWEVHEGHILTDLDRGQMEQLRALGYEIEILYRDRRDLYRQRFGSDPLPLGDAGLYHTYAEVKSALLQYQADYPDLAQVVDIGDSWGKIQGVNDHDILALRISDNVGVEEGEAEVLFTGAHHAREWISVEVPLYLADQLLTRYQSDPGIRELVDNGDIWLVPMVNPDGHQHSVDNNRWWRKNLRDNGDGTFGVDLNRNYAYEWGGPGSSGNTGSDTYRGPSPFSEPETQAIRDLALAREFQAMVSYHSYGQLILYPFGYGFVTAPENDLMHSLASDMSDLILGVHGEYYEPNQGVGLYPASGTTDDWFYGELGVIGFTIELRPVGFPYFELPESEILPTCEENLPAALHLISWTQKADPAPQLLANGGQGPLVIGAGEPLLLDAALTAGNRDTIPGDWWIAADTPSGWYHYSGATQNWLPDLNPTFSGTITDIPLTRVLEADTLDAGDYTFYFGIESNANRAMDQDILFLESLDVTVTP